MTTSRITQLISDALCLTLIIRLLAFRLHKIYRVFCIFLAFDLLSSGLALVEVVVDKPFLDYRITWMATRPIAWLLSLWMVYELLGAVLSNLPGILKASRFLLNTAFPVAIVVALFTARGEYLFLGTTVYPNGISRAVVLTFILERVVSTTALIVLASILAFIIWFPVEMPRNLALFSFGFVVYFASKVGLFLLQSYWSHQALRTVSDLIMFVLAACFAYWIAFINPEGEKQTVRVGHAWRAQAQPQYLGQLEAINSALMRAAAKSR